MPVQFIGRTSLEHDVRGSDLTKSFEAEGMEFASALQASASSDHLATLGEVKEETWRLPADLTPCASKSAVERGCGGVPRSARPIQGWLVQHASAASQAGSADVRDPMRRRTDLSRGERILARAVLILLAVLLAGILIAGWHGMVLP